MEKVVNIIIFILLIILIINMFTGSKRCGDFGQPCRVGNDDDCCGDKICVANKRGDVLGVCLPDDS